MTALEAAALSAALAQAAAAIRLRDARDTDADFMLVLSEYQIACDAAEQAFIALAEAMELTGETR